MMHTTRQSGLALIAAAICIAPAFVRSEADEEPRDPAVAEDMVVTATRGESAVASVPAHVTVLTGEELREASVLNVADALRTIPGVQVRRTTGSPASAEIDMRGFGENAHGRTLVLLDGRKLNRPDMASLNWLQISPAQIDRIEVVRGGASALYGDHAVAGIVHVITRDGGDEPSFELGVEGGSFGTLWLRAGAFGHTEAWTYSATADRLVSDGYRDRTGFLSQGASVRLGHRLAESVHVEAGADWRETDAELPGGLTRRQMREDPKASVNEDDETRSEHLNTYTAVKAGLGPGELSARFSYDRKMIEADMESYGSFTDSDLDALFASLGYSFFLPVRGRNSEFSLGVDYSHDWLDADRYFDAARTWPGVQAELSKRAMALFVRNETMLGGSLVFSSAGRYEAASFQGDAEQDGLELFDDRSNHRAATGEAALAKILDAGAKLYAKGGTLYRYPFLDEQISYTGFGADGFFSDISPERGWNAEMGGRFAQGNFVGEMSVFHIEMRNEIDWNPEMFRNENLHGTRRRGVESCLTWEPDGSLIRLTGSYTYIDSSFRDGPDKGNRIPLVPEHQASAQLGVALPANLTGNLTALYTGERRIGGDSANVRDRLSGFTVFHFVLHHAPELVPGLRTYVAVDNVLDRNHATFAYAGFDEDAYYPEPGRGFRVGARWEF